MLAVALGLALAGAIPEGEPRWLVAVGANVGLPEETPLTFAHRDARRFAEVMKSLGGARTDAVWVLEDPSPEDVESTLSALARRARAEGVRPTLFWYFSGHADDRALHLGAERWPIAELERQLADGPFSLRLIVVDGCRGVDAVDKGGLTPAAPFSVEVQGGLRGLVRLQSASPGELSQESDRLRAGVFTHQWLTGLRGAADSDGDQRVSFDEAYRYAFSRTVRYSAVHSGRVMHPSIALKVEGTGQLILTDLRGRGVSLTLPGGAEVRYLVFDRELGDLVAEVWGRPRATTDIRLPRGDYLVVRHAAGNSDALELTLDQDRHLSEDRFIPVPSGELAAKGSQLRLSHWQLTPTYSAFLGTSASIAQQARLRLTSAMPRYRWSASLELGQTTFDAETTAQREQWIGGDVRYERRLWWRLFATGGVAWRVVQQRVERTDADDLTETDVPTEMRSTGFAAGPTLGLSLNVPVLGPASVILELRSVLFFRGESGSVAARPEIGPEAGVTFVF